MLEKKRHHLEIIGEVSHSKKKKNVSEKMKTLGKNVTFKNLGKREIINF